WRFPTAVVAPVASGSLFTKVRKGFEQFLALGLVEGQLPHQFGAQAEGCAPVATAFASGERVQPVRPDSLCTSLAIGAPADGDLAVQVATESGGAVYSIAEEEIGLNIPELAASSGGWGESATGGTLG